MRGPRVVWLSWVALALLIGAGTVGLLAATPGNGPKARPRAVYADSLPNGEGRHLAERWCMICHSATLITQQAKDSTGWDKTIVQMEKWGVTLSPAEHDTLRAYLVARLGTRTAK